MNKQVGTRDVVRMLFWNGGFIIILSKWPASTVGLQWLKYFYCVFYGSSANIYQKDNYKWGLSLPILVIKKDTVTETYFKYHKSVLQSSKKLLFLLLSTLSKQDNDYREKRSLMSLLIIPVTTELECYYYQQK